MRPTTKMTAPIAMPAIAPAERFEGGAGVKLESELVVAELRPMDVAVFV